MAPELLYQILIGAGTLIAMFVLMRAKTAQHSEQIAEIRKWQKEHSDGNENRINGGFKRLDNTVDRVTVLEQNSKQHLDLKEAEEKFVSKEELRLQLETIAVSTAYTRKEVDKIEGKLDTNQGMLHDILGILNDRRHHDS